MITINQHTVQLLFALLRSAICGDPLQEEERNLLTNDHLAALLALSQKHDIAHLLALALNKNSLLTEGNQEFERTIIKALYRYEQLNCDYGELCNALESAQISFIPLKGSVLRRYYPEPWMRTSCDIDILIQENDIEKAAAHLTNCFGYAREKKGSHDISLFSRRKSHIELHYDLMEDDLGNSSSNILKSIWDISFSRESGQYQHEMPDHMFYFYHIAHMAKHFANGGCGIRPFIDLWILDHLDGVDQTHRDELLKQGNLLKFAETARLLSRVWFDRIDHNDITKQMEQFVLRGGAYGTRENHIAVQQQKKGGRIKYTCSKIFLPYDTIKFHYPILQKYRWLTPVMEVRRWGKLIFCGHAKRTMNELAYNNSISREEAKNTKHFLQNIGL